MSKHWYQSLTLGGLAVLTICTIIMPAFGLANIADALKEETASITEILNAVVAITGLIVAVIGRLRSHTTIIS